MATITDIVRVSESGSMWGLCEDSPVLFHCNGQCGKNPLPEPTLKNIHQHALLMRVPAILSNHTMYFHTHTCLCQSLWIWKWIYTYLLLCESSGSRLSPTHTHSHAGLHLYIHWPSGLPPTSISLNCYCLLVSIKKHIVLTSLQIYISLNISHLKCVWCHPR